MRPQSRRRNSIDIALVLAAMLGLFLGCRLASAADAPKPPRYSLPLGRKLTYTGSSTFKSASLNESDTSTWQALVVAENPDGSSHILLQLTDELSMVNNGNSNRQPQRIEVGYVDLYPDGHLSPKTPAQMRPDPSVVFPQLPSGDQEMSQGWTTDDPVHLVTNSFSAKPSETGQFTFSREVGGLMKTLYGESKVQTCHFDPAKGILVSADGISRQTYGFNGTGNDKLKLWSDEMVNPDEVRQIASQYEILFQARDAYQAKLQLIEQSPADARQILTQAAAILNDAMPKITRPQVRDQLQKMISNHDSETDYEQQTAQKILTVIDKPAFSFDTVDYDGKPQKLADYHGKVVVLDFWYRGCGWCMYAMPQIKQIADDFKDKPVIVLGMNNDRDPSDAKTVIDAQKLNYPTLKATDMPEKFGVQGFPTLIVIDQQGIVRAFHIGYSPTLRADVGKIIQGLLDHPPSAVVNP